MEAPNKIYVEQKAIMYDLVNTEPCKPDDLEYIRKDALLEWLDGKMTIEEATEGFVGGYDRALKDVIDKLNSM